MESPASSQASGARELRVAWLGRVPYAEASALQERLRTAVLDEAATEALLLLEHPPVVTLGRSADPAHVLLDEESLRARGVELARSSRGGDVTYHGPGQLVAYPIVRLDRGVAAHVEAMAAAVVELLAARGVAAAYRRDRPGVWIADDKICAFGVHVHRRVGAHGLALNVTIDPADFSLIVPCGLGDTGVTSLARATGAAPTVASIAVALAPLLARHLQRSPPRWVTPADLARPPSAAAP